MNGLPVTICLIASIVVCYGTGNWRTGSYLAGALPLRLIQLRRNARRRQFRFHYFPNPLLFDSPPSTAAEPFFRLCPELAAQTERRLRWAIGSPPSARYFNFFFLFSLFAAVLLDRHGFSGALPIMLLAFPALEPLRRLSRRFKLATECRRSPFSAWPDPSEAIAGKREAFLAAHPRPPLRLDEPQCRNRFIQFYRHPPAAAVALELAMLFKADFFFYPQDEWLLLCPDPLRFHRQIERHFSFPPSVRDRKVYEIVNRLAQALQHHPCRRERKSAPFQLDNDLVIQPVRLCPPPLLPDLAAAWQAFRQPGFQAPDEKILQAAIAQRPPLSRQLFVSYWPDRKRAAIALQIRELAVEYRERPATMMCYPNDPVPLLTYQEYETIDGEEFLEALEKSFSLTFPEKDLDGLFRHATFAELVEYIHQRLIDQGVFQTGNAGETAAPASARPDF